MGGAHPGMESVAGSGVAFYVSAVRSLTALKTDELVPATTVVCAAAMKRQTALLIDSTFSNRLAQFIAFPGFVAAD